MSRKVCSSHVGGQYHSPTKPDVRRKLNQVKKKDKK
jgi:hypothetical protein